MLRQHQTKLAFSGLLLLSSAYMACKLGELKQVFDWLDVLGEGTAFLVAAAWLLLILSSRPSGRVTELLYYGSLCLVYSYFLNLLDEFLQYPEPMRLMSWLESIPAPLGMLVLTFGLVGWHREQRAIDRQLRGRELFLRDHNLIDPLTQLYGLEYLYAVLDREISLQRSQQQSLSLIVVDVAQFSEFNRQHGFNAGDDFLSLLSELVISQLRQGDVVCRYSGDCFVAILPNTNHAQAELLAMHLAQCVQKLKTSSEIPAVNCLAVKVDATHASAALERAFATLAITKQTAEFRLTPI
jgi:diguanylate cyclase (GGDEF)-like protein